MKRLATCQSNGNREHFKEFAGRDKPLLSLVFLAERRTGGGLIVAVFPSGALKLPAADFITRRDFQGTDCKHPDGNLRLWPSAACKQKRDKPEPVPQVGSLLTP